MAPIGALGMPMEPLTDDRKAMALARTEIEAKAESAGGILHSFAFPWP